MNRWKGIQLVAGELVAGKLVAGELVRDNK